MSLGPTNNNTSINRNDSIRRQQEVQSTSTPSQVQRPTDVTGIPEAQRVPATAESQAQSRAANAGTEEAVRQQMMQSPAAPAANGVRRGLEGWEEAGRRSASGRRTAELESAPGAVQLASLGPSPELGARGVTGAGETSTETPNEDQLEAGKRSASGRRTAEAETGDAPEELLLAGRRDARGSTKAPPRGGRGTSVRQAALDDVPGNDIA